MLSCRASRLAALPTITVYMNCDTRLAININLFELNDCHEFIFAIKNHDYVDSSYAFLYRAKKSDADENGEVIFNIDPDASKNIKPGAFYNFAVLRNAFNYNMPSEYKKLTENGKVIIEYGAQDLALPAHSEPPVSYEILEARIRATDKDNACTVKGVITGVRFEDACE
jgi:hypothetical protein